MNKGHQAASRSRHGSTALRKEGSGVPLPTLTLPVSPVASEHNSDRVLMSGSTSTKHNGIDATEDETKVEDFE
jgi:hypothetical protein